VNIFTFDGNLGKDLDVRFTPNGKCVGEFSVASKQGFGEHEKTTWINCKLLGERAQKLQQYLTKGSKVTVSGEFTLEEWEKDGIKHSKPVVIVRDLVLPSGGNKTAQQQQGYMQHQAQHAQQQAAPQQAPPFDDSLEFGIDPPF